MARYSIPQKCIKPNIRLRKTKVEANHTKAAGLPIVRMAWDTLDMDRNLEHYGFTKKNIPATSLVFAGVSEATLGASSNVKLQEYAMDPVVQATSQAETINNVTISRFINDQRYPWYELSWMLADKLQQFEVSSARKDGYLIIDDTIIEKFGKSMQGIHKLKDPATGAYVLGYNVVNLLYADGYCSYPLGFEYRIWDDELMGTDDELTKPKLALALLKQALRRGYCQEWLFDSAYLCKGIIQLASEEGIDWIAKCKSNRLFVYNGQFLHAKDIAVLIPSRMYRRHKKHRDIEYTAVNAELPGHGLSRLVIVRNLREDEKDSESIPVKHLVCSKPGTYGSAIVTKYKLRWKVETFHRTVKQNFGLLTYHGRKLCGHIAHTALVYMAYTLTVFIQRCFSSLKGESLGYIVVSIIPAIARIKVSSSALTVLIPRDFPNSRFVREFQSANTG